MNNLTPTSFHALLMAERRKTAKLEAENERLRVENEELRQLLDEEVADVVYGVKS